ncbi:hypothetical protein Poli38472_008614 [Pythium oligandrum]|uniref:Kinesin motor domain-containing protein n=1 Tax=Pythium oligandrum TaxID=41045 RepID=A0A8K1FBC4_PYTOL|nr:hypothetical protein Poli38472_008614 [Pythium oligandrum]|eukprot:TMW55966.1 hypothetical protein Poli38472_008614 [Pythium oligandrum]
MPLKPVMDDIEEEESDDNQEEAQDDSEEVEAEGETSPSRGSASPSGENHIITAVRVRPMFVSERKAGYRRIIDMASEGRGNWTRIVNPVSLSTPSATALEQMSEHATQFTHDFYFDHRFWSYDRSSGRRFATQATLYEDLGVFAIDSAWQGYNCSIFAYGQTSAGKTYTMMGDTSDKATAVLPSSGTELPSQQPAGMHPRQGLIPRVCKGLFDKIEQATADAARSESGSRFSVHVSYVEVYHERVYDLLGGLSTGKESLKVREHPEEGVYVEHATQRSVKSFEDIKTLIDEGNRMRSVAATNVNERSSRSHAILTLYVKQQNPVARVSAAALTRMSWMADPLDNSANHAADASALGKKSKICLVDLAGSERADISGATGKRLKEAGSINRSLSILADVISALSRRSASKGTLGANSFVPYRNSVLTRLLKESLGGNAKTVMLAAISPCCIHFEETLSTLKYIERAKNVVNNAKINTENSLELVQELRREISELRAKLQTTSVVPLPLNVYSVMTDDSLRLSIDPADDTSPVLMTKLAAGARTKDMKVENVPELSPSREKSSSVLFNDIEHAKMEREIARLRLQLEQKDRELMEKQPASVGNQRHDADVAEKLRRQALLLNLMSTYRMTRRNQQVRAFERWRSELRVGKVIATIRRASPKQLRLEPDEVEELVASLDELASGTAHIQRKRADTTKQTHPRAQSQHQVNAMCASVVDSVLFGGQVGTTHQPHEAAQPPRQRRLSLETLEVLTSSPSHDEETQTPDDGSLDVSLSPWQNSQWEEENTNADGSGDVVTLDLPGISDSDFDRVLQETLSHLEKSTLTPRGHTSFLPLETPLAKSMGSTSELETSKQQIQHRLTKCLDAIDLGRKYMGPTLRRLRRQAHQDEARANGRTGLSTIAEQQLLRHIETCLLSVLDRLNEAQATLECMKMHPTKSNDALESALQHKLGVFERIEALLTVFALHVLRRVCDQLCDPVTMALVSKESIADQLTSYQGQLMQAEMWADLLVPWGTDAEASKVDSHMMLALMELYGVAERMKATWFAIDQKHHLYKMLHKSRQDALTTSTETIRVLTQRCRELELILSEVTEDASERRSSLEPNFEVMHLTDQISSLSSELLRTKQHTNELMQQVKLTQQALNQVFCERDGARTELEDLTIKYQELQLESDANRTELTEQLENDLAAARARVLELEATVPLLEAQVARLRELQDTHDHTSLRVIELEDKLAAAQSDLVVASQLTQELEDKLASAQHDSGEWQQRAVAIDDEVVRLQTDVTRLTESNAGLAESNASLAESNASLTEQSDRLKHDIQRLTARNEQLDADIQRLTDEKVCLDDELQRLITDKAQVHDDLEHATQQNDDLVQRNSDLVHQMERIERDVDVLTDERDAARTELEDLTIKYQELQLESDAKLTDLQDRLDDEVAAGAHKLDDSVVACREVEMKLALALDEYRELVARYELMDGERMETIQSLDTANERYQQLATDFWSQSVSLATMEEDLTRARVAEEQAKQNLVEHQKLMNELKSQSSAGEKQRFAEISRLREELSEAQTQLAQTSEAIVELTTMRLVESAIAKRLEEEIASKTTEWEAKYTGLTANALDQVASLTSAQAEIKRLEKVNQSLIVDRSLVIQLEGQLAVLQSRYDALLGSSGDDQHQIDWEGQYNGLMSDMHVRIQELQGQLEITTDRARQWEERAKSQTITDTAHLMTLQVEVSNYKEQLQEARQQLGSLQKNAVVMIHQQASSSSDSQPNAELKSTEDPVVLKHLDSLDSWFEEAILHGEAPTDAPVHMDKISEIESFDELFAEEGEKVWSVECDPTKPQDTTFDEPPKTLDAATETSDLAENLPPARVEERASLPTEVNQLRSTVVKLKMTLDEKEELIAYLDGRMAYYESVLGMRRR